MIQMSEPVVSVEGLSKQYVIGSAQARYETLRDVLAGFIISPVKRIGSLLRGGADHPSRQRETIWALRDVSFGINKGEVVGIIGRNGAGKSTLLKVLSRITEPTSGAGVIRGRVGSLLEVGTGFHPELTGRENIYLNGAILGMKRRELHRKLDEIVSFAEVEKFVDTPVKHYSSGMYLRLAFAVAAHLETEVLIVDEVLAVGDAAFQKKCLSKMEDVGKAGRTVIFVSHNMPAVANLCSRAILMGEGRVELDGPSHSVVSSYLSSGAATMAEREWSHPEKSPGGEIARLHSVRVRTQDGVTTDSINVCQPVVVEMRYEVLKPGYVILPHYNFYNEEGLFIFPAIDNDQAWRGKPRPKGRYVSSVTIPGNLLRDGVIYVWAVVLTLSPFTVQCSERDAVAFSVIDNFGEESARADWTGPLGGVVRPLFEWTTEYSPNGTFPVRTFSRASDNRA